MCCDNILDELKVNKSDINEAWKDDFQITHGEIIILRPQSSCQ